MRYARRLTFVGAVFTFFVSATLAENNRHADVVSVLADHFETVYHIRGQLLAGYPPGLTVEETNAFRMPFWYFGAGLEGFRAGHSQRFLLKSGSLYMGAKDFRGPGRGVGPTRSSFCYIIVYERGGVPDLPVLMRSAVRKRMAGMEVFSWTARLREFGDEDPKKPTPFFLALIGDSVLLANSADNLQIVSEGLAKFEAKGPSTNFDESQTIQQQAIWAYRRYRHQHLESRDMHAAGLTDVDSDARALILVVDPDERSLTLKVIGSEGTARRINSTGQLPLFSISSGSVWVTSIPLDDKGTDERILFIMSLFGYGIYI